MNELHEAFDHVADEITPTGPPVEATMLRGRRMRNRRRTAFITGTAGAMALLAGAAAGIPALASHPADQGGAAGPATASGTTSTAKPMRDAFRVRQVLFFAPRGGTTAYGDARLVNTATMKLFHKLTCKPGPNALAVNDRWKATVGYTAAQWNAPGSEIVSCDATGSKYILGKAVFGGNDITSVTPALQRNIGQWVVNITLNGKATTAFGALTMHQFNTYFPGYQSGDQDDAVLNQIAVVINGDAQSAPEVNGALVTGQFEIAGPQPAGFTEGQAKALAAQL
jgi:hypothetical protein